MQEEDEEGTWAEDFQAVEMLTKGAGAVGAGVKSVALASTPLKLKPDGRIVMNADGLLNLVRAYVDIFKKSTLTSWYDVSC